MNISAGPNSQRLVRDAAHREGSKLEVVKCIHTDQTFDNFEQNAKIKF